MSKKMSWPSIVKPPEVITVVFPNVFNIWRSLLYSADPVKSWLFFSSLTETWSLKIVILVFLSTVIIEDWILRFSANTGTKKKYIY